MPSTRFDQGEYPGHYYRIVHRLVGDDVEGSIVRLRAVNVAVAVILLTLLLALADTHRALFGYVVAGSIVPLGLFIIGSVNPSSWAVTGLTTAGLSLVASGWASTAHRRISLQALAVGGALLAVAARGDAGAYLVVTVVAIALVTARRDRRWLLTVAPIYALVMVVGLISFITARQATILAGTEGMPGRTALSVLARNVLELPGLLVGSFGGWSLGWLDTPMPAVTWVGSTVVASALFVIGLGLLTWRKLLALLAICGVAAALPLYMLQKGHYIVGEWVQPRYILPLVPIAILLAVLGRAGASWKLLGGGQPLVFAALLTLANSAALATNLRRYLTGLDGGFSLGPPYEWWWRSAPDPRLVWVVGSMAFGLVCLWIFVGPQLQSRGTTTQVRSAIPPSPN